VRDLHAIGLDSEDHGGAYYLEDWSVSTPVSGVAVYFHHLEQHLIRAIHQADVVVGCVAWLTHPDIIAALSTVPRGVALVVQKEDFLRPDFGQHTSVSPRWRETLRQQYAQLPWTFDRNTFPAPLGQCSYCSGPEVEPVRCVGNYNGDQDPAFPRMHHKFLVFCRVVATHYYAITDEGDILGELTADPYDIYSPLTWESDENIEPYAVWTGSFNLTKNATLSLENAVYITIPEIVDAYYKEWVQLEAFSEPLNWQHEWVAPEWRIGS